MLLFVGRGLFGTDLSEYYSEKSKDEKGSSLVVFFGCCVRYSGIGRVLDSRQGQTDIAAPCKTQIDLRFGD